VRNEILFALDARVRQRTDLYAIEPRPRLTYTNTDLFTYMYMYVYVYVQPCCLP
jgi:hypothetical protein